MRRNVIDSDVREHYEVERELADRLRSATDRDERRGLYPVVYDERLRRIPSHPLILRAQSDELQSQETERQLGLLEPFLSPATRFLEVGPGDCALAAAVAPRVASVCVVDVSRALCNLRDWPENLDFRLSDGVSVPVEPRSIDLAYSNQVLEHLHPDDAEEHLHGILDAMREGGRFVCITPNRLSGPWDISRRFDTVATGLHLREYTIRELAELLRRVGFSSVECFISYHGRRLSPVMGTGAATQLEELIGKTPSTVRQRIASLLAAVKIVALK